MSSYYNYRKKNQCCQLYSYPTFDYFKDPIFTRIETFAPQNWQFRTIIRLPKLATLQVYFGLFLWLLEHNCFIILYLCLLKSFWCNFVRFSDPKTQLFVFCQLLFISLPFLLTFNLYVVVDSYVKRMPYFSSVANYSWLQKSATLEMSNS